MEASTTSSRPRTMIFRRFRTCESLDSLSGARLRVRASTTAACVWMSFVSKLASRPLYAYRRQVFGSATQCNSSGRMLDSVHQWGQPAVQCKECSYKSGVEWMRLCRRGIRLLARWLACSFRGEQAGSQYHHISREIEGEKRATRSEHCRLARGEGGAGSDLPGTTAGRRRAPQPV